MHRMACAIQRCKVHEIGHGIRASECLGNNNDTAARSVVSNGHVISPMKCSHGVIFSLKEAALYSKCLRRSGALIQ